jgi:predicted glycoside hydrolase/deacetylase ChbG (UPF0249 family)
VTAPAARVLAVCADDVGLVEGVAETVLDLAGAGRLNAASCVTTAPRWRRDAMLLASDRRTPQLGLHFNLSEGAPLSAALAAHWPTLPSLGRLLVLAHLGRLPVAAIEAEFRAQADAFADAVGRLPAFVDGHQHVHALRGVREAVLAAIARWPTPAAVRNTGCMLGPGAALKRTVIVASGGRALQRALVARGIAHNRALLGAYDFGADYRRLMQAWLARAPREGGLVFCHPCAAAPRDGDGDGDADPIAAARRREAAYFASDAFPEDLAAAGVTLGAAWATRSSSAD